MMEEAKKRDHRKLGKELRSLHDERCRPRIPVLPSKGNGLKEHTA